MEKERKNISLTVAMGMVDSPFKHGDVIEAKKDSTGNWITSDGQLLLIKKVCDGSSLFRVKVKGNTASFSECLAKEEAARG